MSKVLGFIIGAVEIGVALLLPAGSPFILGLLLSGGAAIAGSAVQLLTGRPHQNLQNDQSIKANVRGTAETHNVVFGKARVGGIVFKAGTYKGSISEDSNNNLLIAIAHSICHPGGCDGIERVWVDDREIPLAQLTQSTTSGVQTTQPGSGPNLGNYTAITHLGTSTQSADSTLVARGLATATDYARGICYSVFNLYRDKNNQDGFLAAYQGRIPLLTVELRGNRCYDPRLDSTAGGSGSQRVNDYTTWTWSDNPAICTATYMIMAVSDGGEGMPPAEIDWAYVAAAANICDQTLTTPAGTQKRYRVSAALSTGDRRNDNRSKLLDAMFGTCVRVGAKYRIYAGAYANPTDTVDETWLAGGPSVVPKTELTQLYNAVRITYTDEKQGYRSLETAPFTNSAFETQDGGDRLFRSISYPTCPDAYQAQLLGAIAGNKSRRQIQVTLKLNWKGLNLDPWQTVSLNIAALPRLAGRTFRVTSWQWTSQGPIVGLSEDNAGDYTIAAYTTVDGAVITTSTTYAPPERVTSLAALAVADGVQLSWVDTNTSSLRKQIYRSAAGANIFGQIGTTTASYFKDAFTTGASYDYKVVVISDYGVTSPDSAIVNSSGKVVADGADVTARAGLVLLQNPSFENGNSGWELQSGWAIANDPANARAGSYVAVYSGGGSAAIVNLQNIPVAPGDQILGICWMKSTSGAAGTGKVRVDFYSAVGGTLLSSVEGSPVGPGTTFRQTRVVATAPAGANYARIDSAVLSGTSGTWYSDDFAASLMPKNQDEVPDGANYGRVGNPYLQLGGRPRIPGVSQSVLSNPGFELNTIGAGASSSAGAVLCDGWDLFQNDFSLWYASRESASVRSGSWSMYLSLRPQAGAVLSNGGTWVSRIGSDPFTVLPGDQMSVSGWFNGSANATPPAGVLRQVRIGVIFYNAAGSYVAELYPTDVTNYVSSTFTQLSITGAVPAGAATARVELLNFITNTSGSSWTPTTGLFYYDVRFDDIQCVRVASLDTDVQDGPTYGRVRGTALTSGNPDLSRSGILNRNLDNLSDTANFSRVYTSRVNAGRPLIDFSEGIHSNKTLDNIFDTASYARVNAARVNLGRPVFDLSESIHANKTLAFVADASGRAARVVYPFNDNGASAGWQWLGTLTFANQPSAATIEIHCGTGYNPNGQQQSTTRLAIRGANDSAAPNLSGLTYYTQGTQVISAVKARANGGSTSAGNRVWDIFVSQTAFSGGTYTVDLRPGDTWSAVGSFPGDPGAASSTIVVGQGNAIVDELARFDFNRGMVLNRNLDAVADTASFARVAASQIISGIPALSVAGSGVRLGDQRNAPPILIANARSKWSGLTITFSYTAASPSIVTISTSAAVLQVGNASVSYAAMSAQVSQARSSNVGYFLYCDDTSFAGGGRTLVITTSGDALYQADGRVYVGSITVAVPASGSGSPTNGGDGGGGACVSVEAFEPGGRQFSELVVADHLQLSNEQLADLGDGEIEQIGISQQVCVTVITVNGAQLTCSLDAPIATPDGFTCAADLVLDQPIATLVDGEASWSTVESVEPRGVRAVRPLYVGNRSFWAGDHPRACILHHNAKVIP